MNAAGAAAPPNVKDIGTVVIEEIDRALSDGKCSPSIEAVAARLSIKVRTLQRRLGEHRLTFRELLDERRLHHALEELRVAESSLCAIAMRLGYSDGAHFARAFRRWTGFAPSQYQAVTTGSADRSSPSAGKDQPRPRRRA